MKSPVFTLRIASILPTTAYHPCFPFHPFPFQDSILIGVLIEWRPVWILHKRDELNEQTFTAHAQFFAKALAAEIGVLRVGVDSPRPLCMEEILEEGMGGQA